MTTSITTILGGDLPSNSRTDINNNFASLNTNKIETSVISTDNTLGGLTPSDAKLPTEKAVADKITSVLSPTGKSWNEYAVANSGTDSYTITVPGLVAYAVGQTFKFKADVANTGACTLNVNGLGAKTIKKNVSEDLLNNEILASQDVIVTYDGTNMQVSSPLASNAVSSPVVNVYTTPGSGTWTKPAGLRYIIVKLVGGGGASDLASSGRFGGGGGGGYVEKTYATSALSATEAYVVGVGMIERGADATNSTFKSLIAGKGGRANSSAGGTGGTATGGDINIPGQPGDSVSSTDLIGARGGSSILGFGGSPESAGTGYGAGGGPNASVGSNGTNGVVIIEEYY